MRIGMQMYSTSHLALQFAHDPIPRASINNSRSLSAIVGHCAQIASYWATRSLGCYGVLPDGGVAAVSLYPTLMSQGTDFAFDFPSCEIFPFLVVHP